MTDGVIDKIIFLDIDHVLTNTGIDNSSFRSLDPSKYRLSKVNLKWLDKILAATSAKIVIASNWRKFSPPNTRWLYDGKWYESTLEPFKELYRSYIIDMLPPKRHIPKSGCLDIWFESNKWFSKEEGKYAILEDDLREGYQDNATYAKHLVLTDYRYGLTEDDALRAVSILNAPR